MPHLSDNIRWAIRGGPSGGTTWLEVKKNGEWVPIPHVTVRYDCDGEEITDDNSGG